MRGTNASATVGIDLGGTKISFQTRSSTGKVFAQAKINTPDSLDHLMEALLSTTKKIVSSGDFEPTGIGIAAAGQIDHENKSILFSPNMPISEPLAIGSILETELKIPVTIENDANTAAIGEKVFGEAKAMDDFITLTLGTGIGSGIFVNGKLLTGFMGGGGEAGHIKIDSGGPQCGCGAHGCLEAFASGSAIRSMAKKVYGEIKTGAELGVLARDGDERAKKIFHEAGERLGDGLVSIINIFSPEAIFFCGSLAHAPDDYFSPAIKKARENSFGSLGEKVTIKVSELGDDIGVIGACSLPLLQKFSQG